MPRYIDADIFKENILQFSHQSTKTIAIALEATPTADVRENVHGRWMGTVCSACGESTSFYYDCDYCPKCGADMRGVLAE